MLDQRGLFANLPLGQKPGVLGLEQLHLVSLGALQSTLRARRRV
jgi:hypothetical protein